MVLTKKRDLPTSATQQEITQAQSLILRGKQGAATGDPKLQRIIAFLESRGIQEAQLTFDQRREALEIRGAIEKQETLRQEELKDTLERQERVEQFEQSREKIFGEGVIKPGEELAFLGQGQSRAPQSFLQKEITGGFETGGRQVPVTDVFFVTETGFKEEALLEEKEFFREQDNSQLIIPEDRGFFGDVSERAKSGFQQSNVRLMETFTEPISRGATSITGIRLDEFKIGTQEAGQSLRERGGAVGKLAAPFEFIGGAAAGTLGFFKEKPLLVGGLIGGGFVVGAGLSAAATGAASLGGATGTALFTGTALAGGIAFGAKEIVGTTGLVLAEPTQFGRGELVGEEFTKLGLLGGGAALGERSFVKFKGFVRTRGLKEIPAEQVLAPEFFKGQTFPSIKPGQSAGQLRKEFFEPILPGELSGVPRGFTARSELLQDIIPPSKGKSGELVGLFQAPKVSPQFLRVSNEKVKLLGFDFPATGKPTIIRLQPSSLEFAPGITSRTVGPRPLGFSAKDFSQSLTGTGKSIIPFVKTEKEAVVALGTPVEKVAERFFIRFEGVRIPIQEFITVPKISIGKPVIKQTIGEISLESSLGRLSSSSIITPSRIGFLGLSSSDFVPSSMGSTIISRKSRIGSKISSSLLSMKPSMASSESIISTRRGRGSSIRQAPISSSVAPLLQERIIGFPVPPVEISPPKEDESSRFFFGGLKISGKPLKTPKVERQFIRTPSLGAVIKADLNLPQVEFGKAAEETGLFSRAFTQPQRIKPLGPFKL